MDGSTSPRHNHVTRDIKQRGKCPACDIYLDAVGRWNLDAEGDEAVAAWVYYTVEWRRKFPHADVQGPNVPQMDTFVAGWRAARSDLVTQPIDLVEVMSDGF